MYWKFFSHMSNVALNGIATTYLSCIIAACIERNAVKLIGWSSKITHRKI